MGLKVRGLLLLLLMVVVGALVWGIAPPVQGRRKAEEEKEGVRPKPCCFPSSFQAKVADMRRVATGDMRVFEVYRDWDRRLQAQRVMAFTPPDQLTPMTTVILDFKQSVQHIITGTGDCQSRPLNYAMLEPCMPDDATFLGETYLGFGEDSTQFRTWSFRRSDHGRNISMIVSVTRHDCVPVMESITGTLGHGPVDTLVTFTTFTELQDPAIFDVPLSCAGTM